MSPLRPHLLALLLAGCCLSPAALSAAAAEEALTWLREYIQIDTTNPPGNEAEAAAYLAQILDREGIESRLLESPEGRVSLYSRLAGSGGGAIVLMHHIDVVPAGSGWRHDPFSGRLQDGRIWGRGAIDSKSLGIAQLAAMVALRRAGARLEKDLVLLAVADEETGGTQGAQWLLDAHPELFIDVNAVLNEGGTNRVLGGRVLWWGIEVVQKRPLWLRVTARGRGGHGSGHHPESATHRLLRALGRLLARTPTYRVSDAARLHFAELARVDTGLKDFHGRLDEIIQPEGPTEMLPPGTSLYFVDSLQVTEIRNGEGVNVVAPEATAAIDIRLLPDTDEEAYLRQVREVLGDRVEVEVLLSALPAAPSPTDGAVYRDLQAILGVRAPVVASMIAGATDSRFFRQRGIPAYGFSPFAIAPEDMRGIHAPNERIPTDAFLRGTDTLYRVVRRLVGAQVPEE